MDPNTTLETIERLAARNAPGDCWDMDDAAEFNEAVESLTDWLDRGGFMPAGFHQLAETLAAAAADYEPEDDDDDNGGFMEFRLRFGPGGCRLHIGPADYDQDHRGYIGSGLVGAGETAADILQSVVDAFNDAMDQVYCEL